MLEHKGLRMLERKGLRKDWCEREEEADEGVGFARGQ